MAPLIPRDNDGEELLLVTATDFKFHGELLKRIVSLRAHAWEFNSLPQHIIDRIPANLLPDHLQRPPPEASDTEQSLAETLAKERDEEPVSRRLEPTIMDSSLAEAMRFFVLVEDPVHGPCYCGYNGVDGEIKEEGLIGLLNFKINPPRSESADRVKERRDFPLPASRLGREVKPEDVESECVTDKGEYHQEPILPTACACRMIELPTTANGEIDLRTLPAGHCPRSACAICTHDFSAMTGDEIYIHMRDHMIEEASPFCPTCNDPLSLIAGWCSEYVNHIGTCLGGSATKTDTTCNDAVDPINTKATRNDAIDKEVDMREYQEAPLQLNQIVNPSWSCPICLHTQDKMPDWEMEVHVLTCVSDSSKGYCPTCNQDLYDLEASTDIINHLKECAVRRWDVVLSTSHQKDFPRIVLQPALDSYDFGFNTLPKICDPTLLHAVMDPKFLSYDRAQKNASSWNNWWMTATILAPEEVAHDTPTALDENDDEDADGGEPQNATSETILAESGIMANHVDTITSNIPYSKMSKATLLRGIRSVSEMINKYNSTPKSLPSSCTLLTPGSTGSAHTKNSTNTVYSKSMNFTCEDELYLEATMRADDQTPLEPTSEPNANVTESDPKGHAKRRPINFVCEDELSRAAQTTEKKADEDEDDNEVELISRLDVETRTITLKSGRTVEFSSLSFIRVEGELLALLRGRDGSLISLARETPQQAALDKKTREKQAPTPPGDRPKTEAQKARKRRQRKNYRANKLAKREAVRAAG